MSMFTVPLTSEVLRELRGMLYGLWFMVCTFLAREKLKKTPAAPCWLNILVTRPVPDVTRLQRG